MKDFHHIYYSFLFSLILTAQGSAQGILFQNLNVDNGLSQNCVISITQDSLGFIWTATQDGLNRYDGVSFRKFDFLFENITRGTYSRLGKVYATSARDLWIFSNVGYPIVMDIMTFSQTSYPSIQHPSAILETKGQIWVGTFGHGLYSIQDDMVQKVTMLDEEVIYDLVDLDKDYILIVTSHKVYKVHKRSYKLEQLYNNPDRLFSCGAKGANGNIWFGTFGEGVFRWDSNSSFDLYTVPFSQNQSIVIYDLHEDHDENLWMASYGKGLFLKKKNGELRNFHSNKPAPNWIHYRDFLSILEDEAGSIWLGTDGAGICYFDPYAPRFHKVTQDQLPNTKRIDVIRSIVEDDDGTFWCGTYGHGLTKVKLPLVSTAKTFNTRNSNLPSDRIIALCYHAGLIWIGAQLGGLVILDKQNQFISIAPNEFDKSTNIFSILPAEEESVYVATGNEGLYIANTNGTIERRYTQMDGLQSNSITCLYRSEQDEIWMGHEQGLISLLEENTNQIKTFQLPDWPIHTVIKSLYKKDSMLWVGTNGQGLFRFHLHKQRWVQLTSEEGLSNNVIYAILPDAQGHLWLSSNKGIMRVLVDDTSTNVIDVKCYGLAFGLQSNEFNTGAYYKSSKGAIYFGGLEGLNWFNPSQIKENRVRPQTVITSVSVNDSAIQMPVQHALSLHHEQNNLLVQFAALQYTFSSENRFFYRLKEDGKQEDWKSLGNKRSIHFYNLAPGDYTLEIQSANYDDVKDLSPSVLSFAISAPWYQTFWAIFGFILLIGAIIYYVIYAQYHRSLALQQVNSLKQVERERRKLFMDITHEIRTPLTLLYGHVKKLSSSNLIQAKESLTHNVNWLVDYINQLLDLNELEEKMYNKRCMQLDIIKELKLVVNSFYSYADMKDINVHFLPEEVELWMDMDPDAFRKIVTNLITNAIKFSHEEGNIYIVAKRNADSFILQVQDQGIGISKADLPFVCNRYYRSHQKQGSGIGLALTKELVEILKGEITIESILHEGTTVLVKLPITNDCRLNVSQEGTYIESSQTSHAANTSDTKGKPCILIAEDSQELNDYLKEQFEKDFNVIQALDGKKALELVFSALPDLIISDIIMPYIDGYNLCNEVKDDWRTSDIPIILLTSKIEHEARLKGYESGADMYINKPFDDRELHSIVNNILNQKQRVHEKYHASPTAPEEETDNISNCILSHLSDPHFSVEDLADCMLVSRATLYRDVKSKHGCSPSQYIKQIRIKEACRLLEDSSRRITDIAYECGFSDPSYFSRIFSKIMQMSPTAYRSSKEN